MTIIDLRSDTLTKPSAHMKEAMLQAVVGDDVFGEDPTVCELEEKVAYLLGKESALFCPSGTMANQIGLGIHLKPGDQVLGHPDNHIYRWEQGAIARHWGASYKEIISQNKINSPGILEVKDFENSIQPDDPHYTQSRLICLENTLNFGGGLIYPFKKIYSISKFAKENHLKMHLDGARLFNAVIATNIKADPWCKPFDTVSICLSKGLGCPIGSLILGPKDKIKKIGIRIRKVLGGGMRQVGILAAAGLYALDHHIERLKEDHKNARIFSEAIIQNSNFKLQYPVETNMVWFCVPSDAHRIRIDLEQQGIKVLSLTDKLLRAVFHLDVTHQETVQACEIISQYKQ